MREGDRKPKGLSGGDRDLCMRFAPGKHLQAGAARVPQPLHITEPSVALGPEVNYLSIHSQAVKERPKTVVPPIAPEFQGPSFARKEGAHGFTAAVARQLPGPRCMTRGRNIGRTWKERGKPYHHHTLHVLCTDLVALTSVPRVDIRQVECRHFQNNSIVGSSAIVSSLILVVHSLLYSTTGHWLRYQHGDHQGTSRSDVNCTR